MLDSIDATEETFKQFVDWKGEKNAYVGFERLLEPSARTSRCPSLSLETDAWRRVEMDARSSALASLNMPPLERCCLLSTWNPKSSNPGRSSAKN